MPRTEPDVERLRELYCHKRLDEREFCERCIIVADTLDRIAALEADTKYLDITISTLRADRDAGTTELECLRTAARAAQTHLELGDLPAVRRVLAEVLGDDPN